MFILDIDTGILTLKHFAVEIIPYLCYLTVYQFDALFSKLIKTVKNGGISSSPVLDVLKVNYCDHILSVVCPSYVVNNFLVNTLQATF